MKEKRTSQEIVSEQEKEGLAEDAPEFGTKRLASSKEFFNNLIIFLKTEVNSREEPLRFLDFGAGRHNLLGRYLSLEKELNKKVEIYIHDLEPPESLGKTKYLTREELENLDDQFFDITHLSAVIHEIGPSKKDREGKGGPATREAEETMRLIRRITKKAVIEDFVKTPFTQYYQNHYFLKNHAQLSELILKLANLIITSVAVNNKEELRARIQETIKKIITETKDEDYKSREEDHKQEELLRFAKRVFVDREHILASEFKKLRTPFRTIIFIRKYLDHNASNKEYEELFLKTGFRIRRVEKGPFQTEWFLE